MEVTLHTTPCPWDQLLSRVIHLQCRLLTQVQTSTLWITVDLRVCSPISWEPTSLPTQVPTSLFFPSLPSENWHTHKYHLFTDLYFNCSHQFTMLVWESIFSWLAISKKADLWRHNSKLSDIFYSVTGFPGCTSPGSLILRRLSLSSLLILPPPMTLSHISVLFLLWFSFLHAQEQGKHFGFLVFFTFFNWVAYDRIFFFKVLCRGLLNLMVIFRACKGKGRLLVLRKDHKNWIGRVTSWKTDVGWWGLLWQARSV